MKNHEIHIINAFTDGGQGGNPAGVVLHADALDAPQKLAIARQIGLSETAFVSRSNVADLKLEFFTPTKQIPHCGHATIATFAYLRQVNLLRKNTATKETIDGVRQIYFEGDKAFMEQQMPRVVPLSATHRDQALQSLGLKSADLLPGRELQIVNTGNSFLIVPLRDESILRNINPDLSVIKAVSAHYDLVGFYVFTFPNHELADATTRMFGPYYGITEEAATGMAAGPLACYLDYYRSQSTSAFTISQGRFMNPPSPSKILVKLEKGEQGIQRLFVGGSAHLVR